MGDVVWLTVAVTGLAALANTFDGVFTVVKYAGAAYLLFIAWKLWNAPGRSPRTAGRRCPPNHR